MLSSTRLQWEPESYSIQSSAWWCVIPSLKRGPKTNSMKFDAEKKHHFEKHWQIFLYPPENVTIFPLFLANIKKKFSAIHPFYFDKNSTKLELVMFFFLFIFVSAVVFSFHHHHVCQAVSKCLSRRKKKRRKKHVNISITWQANE